MSKEVLYHFGSAGPFERLEWAISDKILTNHFVVVALDVAKPIKSTPELSRRWGKHKGAFYRSRSFRPLAKPTREEAEQVLAHLQSKYKGAHE